jgi:hypothetical protein
VVEIRKGGPPWKLLIPAAAAAVILVGWGMAFFLRSSPPPPSTGQGSAAAAVEPSMATPPAPVVPVQTSGPAPAGPQEAQVRPADLVPVAPIVTAKPREGRPQSPSQPPPDTRKIDQETHQREVALMRETLHKGIDSVRDDVEAKRFSAARERLSQLQETAVPYRADLIDEEASLRALEHEITTIEIRDKTADLTRQQDDAAWKRRLQEIRGLLQDKRYPEAKTMANKLAGEDGVPEATASEARDLAVQADQEMKSIFGATKVKSKDEVLKKPPR